MKLGQLSASVDAEFGALVAEWNDLRGREARLVEPVKRDIDMGYCASMVQWSEFRLKSEVIPFKARALMEICDKVEAVLQGLILENALAWWFGDASSLLTTIRANRMQAISADSCQLIKLAARVQMQMKECRTLTRGLQGKQARLTELALQQVKKRGT